MGDVGEFSLAPVLHDDEILSITMNAGFGSVLDASTQVDGPSSESGYSRIVPDFRAPFLLYRDEFELVLDARTATAWPVK